MDSKDVRTYERDRQRSRKPADRRKNLKKVYQYILRHRHEVKQDQASTIVLMHKEAVACILSQNWGEGNADKAWEEVDAWTPACAEPRCQVELLHIAKPARRKRKGPTKDFVMVPSVPRVHFLDDAVQDVYDDHEEDELDWEVVGGHLPYSYASVARP